MKKNIFIIFFCFIFLFYLPLAADEKKPGQVIRIGMFPLEPLNFIDDQNIASGLYPALIEKIAEQENWGIEYVRGSWAECLGRLQAGEIDLMTTIAFSEERAMTMDFSKEPVVDIWGQVFALPEKNIHSILDLNQQAVAVMKKDISAANFIKTAEKFGVRPEIMEFDSHNDVFKATKEGWVVAGVAPQHFGLRHSKGFDLVGTSIQFSPFSVFFATKKGQNRHLLSTIDSYLSEWKKDKSSVYYEELSSWMGMGKYTREIIPKWLLLSLIIAGAVSAVLFIFARTLKVQVLRKTMELQESEKQYRELVEGANAAIVRWDTSGKIIFINRFGLDLFGCSQDQISGHLTVLPPFKNFSQKDLQQMIDQVVTAPDGLEPIETEHISHDTKKIHLQWNNKAIRDNQGSPREILSVGTDITYRQAVTESNSPEIFLWSEYIKSPEIFSTLPPCQRLKCY